MEMKTIDSIYARVCERRTNYETVVVSKFPELFPISRPIVLGQYSMTEQAGKRGERRRFITRRDSIKLGEHIETPTAIARDYLNVEKLSLSRSVAAPGLALSSAEKRRSVQRQPPGSRACQPSSSSTSVKPALSRLSSRQNAR